VKRIVLFACSLILSSGVVFADVRAEEKSQVKFEGMLGRMINLFGGGDPVTQTVSVKGNRKATMSKDRGQIIDLAEEKIYDLDIRRKTYTVTTFADLRKRMEEARQKAASQSPSAKQDAGKGPEVEIDFSLKESGQRKTINGFDAREVVMTVSVREKGKTLEQSGGMAMTSNTWLAPKVAGMSEIAEFDRRYAEKLASAVMLDAQTAAMAAGMYPMMADAMKRMQAENVNLDGTPVLTVVKMETVASAEQAKAAPAQQESRPTGLGGLGGALARRAMRRGDNDAAAAGGRSTVMTMQHELVKASPSVADVELAIPAGFSLK
jgi:hypothetical protein